MPTIRVLIVDDDEDTTNTLRLLMQALGFEPRGVCQPEQAIDAAKEFLPHIILLDVAMPGKDGYTVLREIRADPTVNSATIVVSSGYCREEDRQHALEAGADHFLAKPVDFTKLQAIVVKAAG